MTTNEIKQALADLYRAENEFENDMIENGGELTEFASQQIDTISAMKVLLTDGADDLGRFIKSVQARKEAIKAERDYKNRELKAAESYEEYLKWLAGQVLRSLGAEKIKSDGGYSFSQSIKTETTVNKDTLAYNYNERVSKLLKDAGIPSYIKFTLTANKTVADSIGLEAQDESLFSVVKQETCKFLSPRASKPKAESSLELYK